MLLQDHGTLPDMQVVITGANRGIGLELARQTLARGDRVYAGVRGSGSAAELAALLGPSDGRLRIALCDVASGESVRAFAAGLTDPVDLLINNAGVRCPPDDLAAQTQEAGLEAAALTFQVNALGALRVTAALLPHLRRAAREKFATVANIGSNLGSIADNTRGGAYGYRMAKAALNMATRSLAQDLRADGITVVVLSPGWVQTDMGGRDAPLSVRQSVTGLLAVLDRLDLAADSGEFLDHRGERVPW